ncbi:MAG: magnesium transporter [Candidatus Nanoarchaeia archaeon]|nr:magnesium transporter [Candidatus Nanoarchaeia archaeon]MDD5587547.1 magnesium transporter [Candidatus Nanoarchaeia archaeon]
MKGSIFNKDFFEIVGVQLVSVIGGLIAGTMLAIYTDKVFLIPGMLILIPGLLEMRNSIDGSFASRLSAGLFLHIINPKHTKTKIIKGNLIAAFLLGIMVSLVLGLVAFGFNYFILKIFMPKIILIPLIAGIFANLIELPLTLFTTLALFKRGYDPNNIMGPFITSTGDIISVISLLITLFIL